MYGLRYFPQENYYLDAIVTVVDAKHVVQHLDDQKPEGVENEVRMRPVTRLHQSKARRETGYAYGHLTPHSSLGLGFPVVT